MGDAPNRPDDLPSVFRLATISGYKGTLELADPVVVSMSYKHGAYWAENQEMALEGFGEDWDEALQMFMDFFVDRFLHYFGSDESTLKPHEIEKRQLYQALNPEWRAQMERNKH